MTTAWRLFSEGEPPAGEEVLALMRAALLSNTNRWIYEHGPWHVVHGTYDAEKKALALYGSGPQNGSPHSYLYIYDLVKDRDNLRRELGGSNICDAKRWIPVSDLGAVSWKENEQAIRQQRARVA
jgi:hypothetical protein